MEAMFFAIASTESRRQTEQSFWGEPRHGQASASDPAPLGWFARLRAQRDNRRQPERTAAPVRTAPLSR